MVRLEDIVDNRATDKNTTHCYLPIYQSLFESKRETATNVLEIGLGHGGSIKLWNDYFVNSTIHCIDINTSWGIRCSLNSPRIQIHIQDAYTEQTLEKFKNQTFDIIVDDGPHTLESMIFCVDRYSKLLKQDGILVVEDIPELAWTNTLAQYVPRDMTYEIYDKRHEKNRFDDILFVVKRV
jgi:spermidine synthase